MNPETQGGLLLLTGGVLARMAATGTFLLYVRAGMRPWLLASAVVLLALGVARIWSVLRVTEPAAPAPADADPDGHDGHDAGHHHGPRVAWLLLLPVLVIVLVAPAPLGSYAASRQGGTAVSRPPDPFPKLTPGPDGTAQMPVAEYLRRALFDDHNTLRDVPIRLTGMVTPEPGGHGETRLTRFVISCCAADARPVQVGMVDPPGQLPPADTWVEVVGRWTPGTRGEDGVPLLRIERLYRVPQPADPYEG